MLRILLSEFWNDLRSQKTRAILTMFAITWGTITVVLLLSFGEGLKDTLVRGLLNAGDRILMVYGGQTSVSAQGLPKGRRIRLTEQDMTFLEASLANEVEAVGASYGRWGVTLETPLAKTTTYMEGVFPTFEVMRRLYPAAGGRFLDVLDLEQKRRVVFLGNDIAARLFGPEDPIGQTVKIDGLPFTVVGVMQDKMQTSMNNGPDAERAIIPASTFRTLYGHQYVDHLLVRPRNHQRAELVESEVYRVLGRKHKFAAHDERALGVWNLIEAERETQQVFLGIQLFLGVVGGLTLLVAGVGVANIMYVVARERTREIGIKRAIGARRRHIVAQFVFEALILALAGGLAGLAVSALIVRLVAGIPNKEDAMEFLGNPELSLPIALTTVAILGGIGLLAGLFPARKAARVDPVESLRYE